MREKDDFSRKEFIPIEAAYCYIEAKHTVNLMGYDPQSLAKACDQIGKVKALVAKRQAVEPSKFIPYIDFIGVPTNTPEGFPKILNPFFGALFARQVRVKPRDTSFSTAEEINAVLISSPLTNQGNDVERFPDLMILGEHNVVLPVLPNKGQDGHRLRSPFFIEGLSTLSVHNTESIAFGVGFVSLMAALDRIQLGVMPWHKILVDGLRLSSESSS